MARTDQRSMPMWLIIAAVLLLVARIVAMKFERKEEERSLVKWVPIEQAMARASAENKPILYDFTAAWCGPCHMLESAVFDDPQLAKRINDEFVPVRVMDRQREEGRNRVEVQALQEQYAVRAFPTIVFADASGAAQARMEGFRGREGFVQVMESVR